MLPGEVGCHAVIHQYTCLRLHQPVKNSEHAHSIAGVNRPWAAGASNVHVRSRAEWAHNDLGGSFQLAGLQCLSRQCVKVGNHLE